MCLSGAVGASWSFTEEVVGNEKYIQWSIYENFVMWLYFCTEKMVAILLREPPNLSHFLFEGQSEPERNNLSFLTMEYEKRKKIYKNETYI